MPRPRSEDGSAAVEPDDAAVREQALAAAPGLDPNAFTLTVTRTGTRGDPVDVTVSYVDDVRVPFVDWLVGSAVTLDTSASARQEFG